MLGHIFSFCFRFLTLTCYREFFLFLLSGILLITLLCNVLYANSVIVCYLALFLPEFYVSISVTVFVAVDFFSRFPNPCYPQHLVSGFVFIVFFNFVLQWPLSSFFSIVTIIFSLFVGIYFFGPLIVKHLLRHRDRVVLPGIGPCLFKSINPLVKN